MNINSNIRRYLDGRNPEEGVHPESQAASFDYCYNYFQSFRDEKNLELLASHENMHQSCLQIGFFLASWGMYNQNALTKKSVKVYEPLIRYIAGTELALWSVNVDSYSEENTWRLLDCEYAIVKILREQGVTLVNGSVSVTLVTKILLGVFGVIPAFDKHFTAWFAGWRRPTGELWHGRENARQSLLEIARFYIENKAAIDRFQIPTLDFETGNPTGRRYPIAKIVDMIGYIEGRP